MPEFGYLFGIPVGQAGIDVGAGTVYEHGERNAIGLKPAQGCPGEFRRDTVIARPSTTG